MTISKWGHFLRWGLGLLIFLVGVKGTQFTPWQSHPRSSQKRNPLSSFCARVESKPAEIWIPVLMGDQQKGLPLQSLSQKQAHCRPPAVASVPLYPFTSPWSLWIFQQRLILLFPVISLWAAVYFCHQVSDEIFSHEIFSPIPTNRV